MIKLLSFALQIFLLKKSFSNTTSPTEFIERSTEKARGYFLFSVGCLIGVIFLLVAIVVAILSIGLQIENDGGIAFTGLMISASLFLAIGVFVFVVSTILLLLQKQKMLELQRAQEKEQFSGTGIAPLVEQILKQILSNISDKKKSQPKEEPASATN